MLIPQYYGSVSIILFMIQGDVNQTYTSIQDTELITVSAKKAHRDIQKCKICHELASPDKQLQSYCGCKEKQAYAHSSCLQAYLENKVNKNLEIDLNHQSALLCQKCDQTYKIQCNIVRKCADFKKFKKFVERKSFLFGVCLIGIVLSIITLAVCADLLKKSNYTGSTVLPGEQKQIVVCFIIFSSLLLLFFIYKIAQKFLTFRVASVEV